MGLRYTLNQAKKLLSVSDPETLRDIRKVARKIQKAEEKLNARGEKLFIKCKTECHGLCCRNLYPDAIISLYDFLFILVLRPETDAAISKCLENENIFYASDCVFLKGGQGPCIFPPNLMPEICITSFCMYEQSVQKEINYIKRQFITLSWFIWLRKPRTLRNKVIKFLRASLKSLKSAAKA